MKEKNKNKDCGSVCSYLSKHVKCVKGIKIKLSISIRQVADLISNDLGRDCELVGLRRRGGGRVVRGRAGHRLDPIHTEVGEGELHLGGRGEIVPRARDVGERSALGRRLHVPQRRSAARELQTRLLLHLHHILKETVVQHGTAGALILVRP